MESSRVGRREFGGYRSSLGGERDEREEIAGKLSSRRRCHKHFVLHQQSQVRGVKWGGGGGGYIVISSVPRTVAQYRAHFQ